MHVFQLLSEPIRRRIIEILASGEHTAGEVTDSIMIEFRVTDSAVSRHLRILRENNAVIVRAEWSNRLYRLDDSLLVRLTDEVHQYKQLWKRRIGTWAFMTEPPWRVEPIRPRRYPRDPEGTRKGRRAKGTRDDPWQRD